MSAHIQVDWDDETWHAESTASGWDVSAASDGDVIMTLPPITLTQDALKLAVIGYLVGREAGRKAGDAYARRSIRSELFADLPAEAQPEALLDRLKSGI